MFQNCMSQSNIILWKVQWPQERKQKLHKVTQCLAEILMESHLDQSNGLPVQGPASSHSSSSFSCTMAGHSSSQNFPSIMLSSPAQEKLNASLLQLLESQLHISTCPHSYFGIEFGSSQNINWLLDQQAMMRTSKSRKDASFGVLQTCFQCQPCTWPVVSLIHIIWFCQSRL